MQNLSRTKKDQRDEKIQIKKGLLILSVKYFFVKFNTDCDIHMHFDTKECQNRLVLKRLNERISEYIWMEFSTQTNV